MRGRNKGLLWKIQSGHGIPDGYLFGTMHSAGATATGKITRILPYIESAKFYFGESDIDELMIKPFQSDSPGWEGLKRILSPASYSKSRHQLKMRYGLDLDFVEHLPPMFLTAFISEKILGKTGQQALDIQLWNLAREAGLILQGLESASEQASIYNAIPLAYQVRQLKKFILHQSHAARSLAKVEIAYQQNDLLKLYRLTHNQLGQTKRVILYDRNIIMADRIHQHLIIHAEISFFALGAAHLPGSKGILRLLKLKGLKLIPILLED